MMFAMKRSDSDRRALQVPTAQELPPFLLPRSSGGENGRVPQRMGDEAVKRVAFSTTFTLRFGTSLQSLTPHHPVSSAHPWW